MRCTQRKEKRKCPKTHREQCAHEIVKCAVWYFISFWLKYPHVCLVDGRVSGVCVLSIINLKSDASANNRITYCVQTFHPFDHSSVRVSFESKREKWLLRASMPSPQSNWDAIAEWGNTCCEKCENDKICISQMCGIAKKLTFPGASLPLTRSMRPVILIAFFSYLLLAERILSRIRSAHGAHVDIGRGQCRWENDGCTMDRQSGRRNPTTCFCFCFCVEIVIFAVVIEFELHTRTIQLIKIEMHALGWWYSKWHFDNVWDL